MDNSTINLSNLTNVSSPLLTSILPNLCKKDMNTYFQDVPVWPCDLPAPASGSCRGEVKVLDNGWRCLGALT